MVSDSPHVQRALPRTHRERGRRRPSRRAVRRRPARGPVRGVRRRAAVRVRDRRLRVRGVPRPVPRPRAVVAALQPAGAGARRGRAPAAARAAALPGDLRQQPRRVLHGAGGRSQAPDRGRRGRARGVRADAARGARPDLEHRRGPDGPARARVPRRHRAFARRARHRAGAVGGPRRRRAEVLQEAVQAAHLPGADPARGRPGAPVPLHLRALAQPRGDRAQPEDRQGALRPGQGAAELQPLRAAARRDRRRPPLRAARGRDRRAPQAAVPRHGGAGRAHLPGHPQRGPRGRGGRHREPAQGARARAAPPQVRPRGAARGRGVDRRQGAVACWSPSSA